MKHYLLFTLSFFMFILTSFASNDPAIYKRINSKYHEEDIIISYHSTVPSSNLFEGFKKENTFNFGGVEVEVFRNYNQKVAYVHFGEKSAWTHFNQNDNLNVVIRELIITTHNN